MALLVAPLFTAGIAVGGIQNANAGNGIFCQFTEGGTAEVTLSLGEESGTINKSIECEDPVKKLNIFEVALVEVDSCTEGVDPSAITPSFSGLNALPSVTASWDETITLESAPGVASFDCEIEFSGFAFGDQQFLLFQTVTINFVPPLDEPIGGTVGSMDTVSLLVAGAQANMGLWSLALVGMVGVVAVIAYKAKSKKTEQ